MALSDETRRLAACSSATLACGGVAVYPGDVIVGEGEGVVVIPAAIADEIATATFEQEKL